MPPSTDNAKRDAWEGKEIRHHMGGHLLEEDWSSKYMNVKAPCSGFPCGMCGVRDAITCDVAPKREPSDPNCRVWILESGKAGIW